MTISGFAAQADIVGRRVQLAWEFIPAAGETLADVPPLTLRRKQRDYAFPAVTSPTDPYLVYDASTFPPAPVPGALRVTDLDGWERTRHAERHVFEPISVAVWAGGRFVEILRRTVVTVFNLNGAAIRQRVEIVDVGGEPGALQANEVYYYQLFGGGLPANGDAAAPYRSTAMVTDSYGQNRIMYHSLPEVYRRHDVLTRPPAPGTDSVPELAPGFGQLRRFIDPFGIAVDSLRGTAEGLRALHDVDRVDARYLSILAQWIGWDVTVDVEIPIRRNEIKSASRLYRLVGTLPGLRALVSQATGWITQVSEFTQNIVRSNQPPRRNLYAITLGADGKTWHGADDAAEILGFGGSNQDAGGNAAQAASLMGTAVEPFSLRPGMALTVAVDGLLPSSMRFGPVDFADIARATASEVAAAINRALPEVRAGNQAGRLTLASRTVGATSLLEIVPSATSLVSLESAPTGRLSSATDSLGRLRLFYEAWETPTEPEGSFASSTGNAAATTGSYVLRRVRYKTFVDGQWRDSQAVFADQSTPQADPAALVLPDGRVWVTWLDNPMTPSTRLRFGLGVTRALVPSRLLSPKREPFFLTDGAVLTLTGNWTGTDRYTVRKADFTDLSRATAAELVAAMNAQVTQTIATREPNGAISLATNSGGATARLAIELSRSTTARALGFDGRTSAGTPGSWSDVIDWSPPLDVVSTASGWHAELAAVNDPAGGARLAWATHRAGLWRIVTAHWNERELVATAGGVSARKGGGPWTAVGGLPSPDVRAIAVDSNGTAWIATAAGVSLFHLDGTIAALAPALPSADVRDVLLPPDGTAWFATAGGIAIRAADGTMTTLTVVSGLPSNDVKALAQGGDGAIWAATASGAARIGPSGSIRVFDTTSGLPSNSVQDITIDRSGTLYVATAAGLAISTAGGSFVAVTVGAGLAAADVRSVALGPDGTLWAATSAGVDQRSPAGVWTRFDTSLGLPSNDTRSVSLAPDGSVWVGTASGLCTIAADGGVTKLDLVGGGATNPAVRNVQFGWSSTLDLASGGGSNREPSLTLDVNGRTWLIWSKRLVGGDPSDSWGLSYRIYDPAASSWGAETALTSPPVGGRAADRTPSALGQDAGLRVFFASDRDGGLGIWSVDVSLTGTIAAPVALPAEASSDLAPLPVTVAGGLWVLYRGDANVALAQASPLPSTGQSLRVPDNGTLRRFAGSVAADLNDLNRLRTRRLFGEMQSYTPNRPEGGTALLDSELYTRGTVGLYVSRANQGADLTQLEADRLRELIQRFVPINLRVVVIVVEQAEEELLYPPGAGIQDSYSDVYPFVSALGAISDSAAAALPGASLLRSNNVSNVSANPASLSTLSRRTYFPPLQ
jgi:phage tail-like protein